MSISFCLRLAGSLCLRVAGLTGAGATSGQTAKPTQSVRISSKGKEAARPSTSPAEAASSPSAAIRGRQSRRTSSTMVVAASATSPSARCFGPTRRAGPSASRPWVVPRSSPWSRPTNGSACPTASSCDRPTAACWCGRPASSARSAGWGSVGARRPESCRWSRGPSVTSSTTSSPAFASGCLRGPPRPAPSCRLPSGIASCRERGLRPFQGRIGRQHRGPSRNPTAAARFLPDRGISSQPDPYQVRGWLTLWRCSCVVRPSSGSLSC